MAFISRGKDPRLSDLFEKYIDEPQGLKKEKIEARKEMAILLREMAQTRGWKEILYPMLMKHGNPSLLFNKTYEQYTELAPKVNAYYNLRMLIEGALRFLEEENQAE